MCTDIRLVRLSDRHISGRTLDFGYDVESRVQVVPRGQDHSAVATDTSAQTLTWSNDLGYVGMDAFGFAWAICDGLNEAGLADVATNGRRHWRYRLRESGRLDPGNVPHCR